MPVFVEELKPITNRFLMAVNQFLGDLSPVVGTLSKSQPDSNAIKHLMNTYKDLLGGINKARPQPLASTNFATVSMDLTDPYRSNVINPQVTPLAFPAFQQKFFEFINNTEQLNTEDTKAVISALYNLIYVINLIRKLNAAEVARLSENAEQFKQDNEPYQKGTKACQMYLDGLKTAISTLSDDGVKESIQSTYDSATREAERIADVYIQTLTKSDGTSLSTVEINKIIEDAVQQINLERRVEGNLLRDELDKLEYLHNQALLVAEQALEAKVIADKRSLHEQRVVAQDKAITVKDAATKITVNFLRMRKRKREQMNTELQAAPISLSSVVQPNQSSQSGLESTSMAASPSAHDDHLTEAMKSAIQKIHGSSAGLSLKPPPSSSQSNRASSSSDNGVEAGLGGSDLSSVGDNPPRTTMKSGLHSSPQQQCVSSQNGEFAQFAVSEVSSAVLDGESELVQCLKPGTRYRVEFTNNQQGKPRYYDISLSPTQKPQSQPAFKGATNVNPDHATIASLILAAIEVTPKNSQMTLGNLPTCLRFDNNRDVMDFVKNNAVVASDDVRERLYNKGLTMTLFIAKKGKNDVQQTEQLPDSPENLGKRRLRS